MVRAYVCVKISELPPATADLVLAIGSQLQNIESDYYKFSFFLQFLKTVGHLKLKVLQ